jgi:hypothetical protein
VTDANPFAGEVGAQQRPRFMARGTPDIGAFRRGKRGGCVLTGDAPGADGKESARVASSTYIGTQG